MVNNINKDSFSNNENLNISHTEQTPDSIQTIGQNILHPHPSEIPQAPPLPAHFWTNLTFWEMTRRVPNLPKLEAQLEQLPDRHLNTLKIVEALSKPNWKDHPIFQNPLYPLYALEAVKKELISEFQFGSLMLFWGAATYQTTPDQMRAVPLFLEGQPNPEAVTLIRNSAQKHPRLLTEEVDKIKPILTDEEITLLFEKMKTAPLSEQQLFVYLRPIDVPETIVQAGQNIGFNLFADAEDPEQVGKSDKIPRLVPSLSLMQTALDVLYGEQAVRIHPTIGSSSEADIFRNAYTQERDMNIPFPGAELPERADGHLAPGIDFSWHDFYHAWVASAAPVPFRLATARAATLAASQTFQGNHKDHSGRIIDLDSARYNRHMRWDDYGLQLTPSEIFWAEQILQAYMGSGIFIDFKTQDRNFIHILADALRNEEEWKSEFGLEYTENTKYALADFCEKMFNFPKSIIGRIIGGCESLETGKQVERLIQEGKEQEAKKLTLQLFQKYRSTVSSQQNQLNQQEIQEYFLAAFTDPKAMVKAIQNALPAIKFNNFTNCKALDDAVLAQLVSNPSYRVHEILLDHCYSLTAATLKSLETAGIQSFSLNGCNQLVSDLSSISQKTESLHLENCPSLQDAQLAVLAERCPKLWRLGLQHNPGITDKGLAAIATIPSLSYIDVADCEQITEAGIRELLHNPKIQTIFAKRCPHLTPEIAKALKEEYPKVNIYT